MEQQRVLRPSSSDPLPLALRAPPLRERLQGRLARSSEVAPRPLEDGARAVERPRESFFQRFAFDTAQRMEKKARRSFPFFSRLAPLAAPPRSCSRSLPRRAWATPKAYSRAMSAANAGQGLLGWSSAFLSARCFFFAMGATTTTLRPSAPSSLTFSLALFSLSPFSRLCFFLALSCCLARWGRTCASIGVRFKGRKEADARERGKEGALERERKQRH